MAIELQILREAARISESGEFVDAVVEAISARLADHPDLCDLLLGDLAALQRRMGIVEKAA